MNSFLKLAVYTLLLFIPSHVLANDVTYGVKFGMISSGVVTLSNDFGSVDWDTGSSSTFGVFVDREVGDELLAGLYFDNHTVKIDDGNIQAQDTLTDLGASIKVSIPMGDLRVLPGLRIGYGSISLSGVNDSSHLLMHGFVEAYRNMGEFSALGEIGFLASPSGGNADFSLTWGPIFYFRGGFAF